MPEGTQFLDEDAVKIDLMAPRRHDVFKNGNPHEKSRSFSDCFYFTPFHRPSQG